MADLYVSDAFGAVHRAHASTAGVADYLPAVSGFLIQKELEVLGGAISLSLIHIWDFRLHQHDVEHNKENLLNLIQARVV